MATRATYQFISEYTGTHTAYIHHDGYPEGAWGYIEGTNCIDAFMAKNDRAEITESHEVHGDTEYRYTMTNELIVAQKYDYETQDYKVIFLGTIDDFVKKYKAKYEVMIAEYEKNTGIKLAQ